MKNLLIIFFFSLSILSINAQRSASPLTFGIAAQAEMINTDLNTATLGSGQNLQAWLQYRLPNKNSLEFQVGFQSLGGFRQQTIEYDLNNFPTEHQMFVHTQQLTGLQYWNLSLNYLPQSRPSSSWSYAIGLRASLLHRVKGEDYKSVYVVSSHYQNISETGLSGGFYYGAPLIEKEQLSRDLFNTLGIGVQARLNYEITEGLQLTASIFQAFNPTFKENAFSQQRNLWLTSAALGFSAQIW
jgi:hypothetical protein